jgi:hypothetical protein
MYRLAKDLGLRLEQVMEMTTLEFRGWAEFYIWEAAETKKAHNKK